MIYKIYKDGELVNRIVADEDFCQEHYSVDGYSYEAEPELPVEEDEPTEADDTAAMLVDHEYRLTLLELGLSEGGEV